MAEIQQLALPVVDGLALDEPLREVLRPGALIPDGEGRLRRLPRFFYRVESWDMGREVELAPGFALWEFINTDVREADLLLRFPRYVPCAVTVLAAHLAVLRARVDALVHIAANGGYRSPGHALSRNASRHHWATAANIYRIGEDYLDTEEKIEHYRGIVREVLPAAWTRPFGHDVGFADDHLHIDLGYVTVVPQEAPGEQEYQED